MKRIIPQQETLICDRCGAEANGKGIFGDPFYFGEMHLVCEDRITSNMGDSAGGIRKYDLCFECMKTFLQWIKK